MKFIRVTIWDDYRTTELKSTVQDFNEVSLVEAAEELIAQLIIERTKASERA